MPGVAAEPGRGTCATTRPPVPPATLDLSFIRVSSTRASAAFIPTTLGTIPCIARETMSLTRWYAESVPFVGD